MLTWTAQLHIVRCCCHCVPTLFLYAVAMETCFSAALFKAVAACGYKEKKGAYQHKKWINLPAWITRFPKAAPAFAAAAGPLSPASPSLCAASHTHCSALGEKSIVWILYVNKSCKSLTWSEKEYLIVSQRSLTRLFLLGNNNQSNLSLHVSAQLMVQPQKWKQWGENYSISDCEMKIWQQIKRRRRKMAFLMCPLFRSTCGLDCFLRINEF